jgi:ATP-dependent RNA helicase DDX24/MAK5
MLVDATEMTHYRNMCRTLNKDEDLPTFPVDTTALGALKEQVDLARYIDKTEHWIRKHESRANWFEQAALDLDVDVDMEEYTFELGDSEEQAARKKDVKNSRRMLHAMLNTSSSRSRGVASKYPTRYAAIMRSEVKEPSSAVSVAKKGKVVEDRLLQDILKKMKQKNVQKEKEKQKRKEEKAKRKSEKRSEGNNEQ